MPRVLVVEDQKRLLASLRRGLEEEGFEVETAPTGEEGYYQATTRPPDVLVLDVMLPGRDGFQVLKDLADRLLFLSRQDAGLLPPAREEVDAEVLVKDVAETMRLVAEEKGVSLSADRVAACRIVT